MILWKVTGSRQGPLSLWPFTRAGLFPIWKVLFSFNKLSLCLPLPHMSLDQPPPLGQIPQPESGHISLAPSLGQGVRSCLCCDLIALSLWYPSPPCSLSHMLWWTKPSDVKFLPLLKGYTRQTFPLFWGLVQTHHQNHWVFCRLLSEAAPLFHPLFLSWWYTPPSPHPLLTSL